MRVTLTVNRGRSVVAVELEGETPKELVQQVADSAQDIRTILASLQALDEPVVASGTRSAAGTSQVAVAEVLESRLVDLAKAPQVDQMIAILYTKFKADPGATISAPEMVSEFSQCGFVRPTNAADILFRASNKGYVTPAEERGRYRITVPGRKRAEELLVGTSGA